MKSDKNDDTRAKKEFNTMSISTLNERYCTIHESIIESFKEVKLMREEKLPKKSWRDFMNEHMSQERSE